MFKSDLTKNRIAYSAPSNIAFVKYWGKHGRQLPMNASISMTLSRCCSHFQVQYYPQGQGRIKSLIFEGQEQTAFKARLQNYLDSIHDVAGWVAEYDFSIHSENTFPHSAGIASSASAMSAFIMCLCHIESMVGDKTLDLEHASLLARLASGSACRSVIPHYGVWGEHTGFPAGNDQFAVAFEDFDTSFAQMNDDIVIVDQAEKSVSSSAGHALMNAHPYRSGRIDQANDNFRVLINAMKVGDFESFGSVLENEALSLHGLMLSSDPSYILLKPNSLAIIEELKIWRHQSKLPVYFTIDAGPNLHLIYPKSVKESVAGFLKQVKEQFSVSVIHDEIGSGPKQL